jgi:hypothetical protein
MSARERYLLAAAAANANLERGRRVRPVEEKHRQAARNVLRKNMPVKHALEAIGYAPQQAKKAWATIKRSSALRKAFEEEAALMEKQKYTAPLQPSWDAREALILNRLEKNIKSGKDKAVMSCKVMGSHKALSLWQPENQTGVIVLNLPHLPAPTDTIPEDPE